MSKETAEWLNTRCLVGFTDRRGKAWHFRQSDQGVEPNHYPGPIPVEDVVRRLFNWTADQEPVFVQRGDLFVPVPNRQAISASDDGTVLGVFTEGYQPHQYQEWLLENVSTLLDDDLGIGSAGLLRNRGSAWVQVEVPDNFTTPEGVEFRPWLLAGTSLDGSLATIYKRGVTDVVCDNTKAILLAEEGQQYRLKHTRGSKVKIGEAREALAILFDQAGAFEAEVKALCSTEVTEREWRKVLEALVPVPEEEGRSRTVATKKRAALKALWTGDERVEPWKNTAYGVVQAFNTYGQHYATVKGSHRVERNFENALSGKIAKVDLRTVDILGQILDKELVTA